jgi:hypothetical protein
MTKHRAHNEGPVPALAGLLTVEAGKARLVETVPSKSDSQYVGVNAGGRFKAQEGTPVSGKSKKMASSVPIASDVV